MIRLQSDFYRLCLDMPFVFQAGSDDGNLWLFNLKNGEYFYTSGKEKLLKTIDTGKTYYANGMK